MGVFQKIAKHKDSVSIIAILLILTKIVGLFKVRMMAGLFGADRALDIFFAASIVPDAIFQTLIAGSVTAAVIPVFADVLHKKGAGKLVKLFSLSTLILALLFVVISVLAYIFTPQISEIMAARGLLGDLTINTSDISKGELNILIELTRIMLISPILLGVSAMLTSFLQVHKKFFITTASPFLYNVGMVVGAYVFVVWFDMGIYGLAWASVLGALLHFVIQIPLMLTFVRKYLNIDSFGEINGRLAYYMSEVWRMVKLATPRVVGMIGEQLAVIYNTIVSFSLSAGALSAFSFAKGLYLLPTQIFAGAISQVALPEFAEHFAKGNHAGLQKSFNDALKLTLYIMLPSAVTFLVLRLPLVRITYGVGEFDWWATVVTSWCLALLAGAIIGYSVNSLTMRALFAIHETWLPLLTTFLGILVNVFGVYYLTNFFSHYLDWRPIVAQIFSQIGEGAAGGDLLTTAGSFMHDLGVWFTTRSEFDSAVGGLALSLTLFFMVEMTLNLWLLQKKTKILSWKETYEPIMRMIVASLITMVAMYASYKVLDQTLSTENVWDLILTFGGSLFTGGVVYIGASLLLEIEELERFIYQFGGFLPLDRLKEIAQKKIF